MRSLAIRRYLSINKAQTNLREIRSAEDFAVCCRDKWVIELTGKARDGSRSE
jgi:hypothetical protein